jgi:HEAT repeat protein
MRYLKFLAVAVCVVGAGALLASCGGGPATPESLVAEFRAVADAALEDIHKQADLPRANAITQQLAAMGPQAIDKLLDILAEPEADPRTKMLVTICVKPVLAKENMPRILSLTEASHNVNTRVNAAHIVGSFNDEALIAKVAELLKDPEPRVRMAVFQTQLLRGTPEALAMVDAMWADKETPLNDRVQLVVGLPEAKVGEHLKMFEEALRDVALVPQARLRAVSVLGRLGDATALAALEEAAAKDPDKNVKAEAQIAWEAAKSRLEATAAGAESPATAPVPAPTAEVAPAESPAS